ncbi:hypothetical protein B0A48_04132 [Cryoendolithus antarcticus]|uniref:Uncharacterized protein n=1 Tax=Cryoendolithus antarcticus TaxID=1507870 RepID=A0A1V8THW5_9PEZI|nr:hypothetical protein B0A48_04132 [Cryoendolithus antarcticus]
MATFEHITSLLNGVDLSSVPNKHALSIDYPALQLLPEGYQLSLQPPANLAAREAPPLDSRRIGIDPATSASHVINLSVSNRPIPHVGVLDILIGLPEATKAMSCRPGDSKMLAVTFHDEELECEVLRIMLATKFVAEDRVHEYTYEMTMAEWKESIGVFAQPWTLTLDELITRSSDLAYYYVRGNIAWEMSTEAAFAEEGRWVHLWGAKELRAKERADMTVEQVEWLLREVKI